MAATAYTLNLPASRETSVVFASPHSGSHYSDEFLGRSRLDRHAIRSSEDAFVDLLFKGAVELGAPLLAAFSPRAFVDFNRAPDELDPALIEGVPRGAHNPRVSSGLGVVPRVVANGRMIYDGKISFDEVQTRLNGYWRPYHSALTQLLAEAHASFGEAILIDCHSMPREAIEVAAGRHKAKPDIVIGDRFGAAASPEVVERVEAAFAAAGLVVARNTPFAGAFTAQHYGRPARRQHVLQVEIDRSLYMDEAAIRPHPDFVAFCALMREVTREIVEIGRAPMSLAAE